MHMRQIVSALALVLLPLLKSAVAVDVTPVPPESLEPFDKSAFRRIAPLLHSMSFYIAY